jgi:hypothetical protein
MSESSKLTRIEVVIGRYITKPSRSITMSPGSLPRPKRTLAKVKRPTTAIKATTKRA